MISKTREYLLNTSLGTAFMSARAARAQRKFESTLAPASKDLIASDLEAKRPAGEDVGPLRAIDLTMDWLCRAQDGSLSADGGVSRHYSLVDGWAVSYPETTGYIVPTFLDEASIRDDQQLRARARRMLDWLVSIQFPEGGFQGGVIGATPRVPVTFNTGQILIGLARGARQFEEPKYVDATHRAASWLANSLDADGCWRKFSSPFAAPGENAYESHVSWGLFEAERAAPGKGYGEAGLKQVRWVISKQRDNGWFNGCITPEADRPLTHVLGYVLRGILEGQRLSGDRDLLLAAERTARALMDQLEPDGWLAGRFNSKWQPGSTWVCLTGSAQIAYCWFLLAELTGDTRFADAARRANAFLRRTLVLTGDPGLVGGVRGSWPVNGDYGQYQFLNWAAKFFVDSNRYELRLRDV